MYGTEFIGKSVKHNDEWTKNNTLKIVYNPLQTALFHQKVRLYFIHCFSLRVKKEFEILAYTRVYCALTEREVFFTETKTGGTYLLS